MSHARVRGLLNKELGAYATLKSYVPKWDNVVAKPTDSVVLEAHLIPTLVGSASLSGDLEEFFGIYQITVVTKFGSGDGTSDTIISELHKIFKANTVFTAVDGFCVQVTTPLNPVEGRTDGSGFWRVPCWFEYRAETFTKDKLASPNTIN